MRFFYSPDGTPQMVPETEVANFIRKGFRERPQSAENGNARGAELNTIANPDPRNASCLKSENPPTALAPPNPELLPNSELRTPNPALISVNSCSAKELTGLPGVGTAIARKVVECRPYERIQDLIDRIPLPPGFDWISLQGRINF